MRGRKAPGVGSRRQQTLATMLANMPSKRPDRRKRPPAALEDAHLGRDDGEDVAVMVGDVGAFLAPKSIRDATSRQRRLASELQRHVRDIEAARVQLQMTVVDARAEGLSWSAIGWCVGLTGEAARKRFGD